MDDLKIRQKCEEMIAYGYIALRQFPKFERHVLAAEIRDAMWGVLRLIIITNKRYHKKTTMQDLDAELDLLRSQVRTAFALRYIDLKKYEIWSRHIDEVGRMIGGWFKSLSRGVAGNA
ncbi:diversity-generating retroelement protein Avd [Roseinatronobacter sp.]|uniref:diversity-generating retroelement protein Avd n=1 Tax=Roseinatronobacter sp. TaxID=1945755 RepID=UPI0025E177B3|nr:diversity-generating retroelement protein Avd [Roseibaca sp.]